MQVDSYIVGPSFIDERVIDHARQYMLEFAAPLYDTLVSEQSQSISEKKKVLYKNIEYSSGTGNLQIPSHTIFENTEACFLLEFEIEIKKLKTNDPLACLIKQVSERLIALNTPCNNFEVRFEKGCCMGSAEHWHTDGFGPYAITICFSSRPDWSTRISKQLIDGLAYSKDTHESASAPSALGLFIDASTVWHRSPKDTDFVGKPLTVDDYRLFIRGLV